MGQIFHTLNVTVACLFKVVVSVVLKKMVFNDAFNKPINLGCRSRWQWGLRRGFAL